jgi:hypothetical protein
MPLHQNKILISSAVYVASLAVITIISGMWHNLQLKNGSGNDLSFIVLVILAVGSLSWFYYTIFKEYRKKETAQAPSEISAPKEETPDKPADNPENAAEIFDKDAFISGILPSNKKNVNEYCEGVLRNLAGKLGIVQGLFYARLNGDETYEAIARYAYYSDEVPPVFKIGETLPGQALKDRRIITLQNIPESYIPVVSGLGSSQPSTLVMVPVYADREPVGLIELAVFKKIGPEVEPALNELSRIVGKSLINLMN